LSGPAVDGIGFEVGGAVGFTVFAGAESVESIAVVVLFTSVVVIAKSKARVEGTEG